MPRQENSQLQTHFVVQGTISCQTDNNEISQTGQFRVKSAGFHKQILFEVIIYHNRNSRVEYIPPAISVTSLAVA